MNHLFRDLAPVSDAAWAELAEAAGRKVARAARLGDALSVERAGRAGAEVARAHREVVADR